ncbi:MAG: hypothetical protein LBC67_05290, partial [Spirochaetales bacterium]|nr:hypothetical protein [Spirochaetales bacterium]
KVDAYEYINDYPFPYDSSKTEELTIAVKLEKEKALSIGGSFNLLIGLNVNSQNFFTRTEGNYILFIHNPQILLRPEWKTAFTAAITQIRTEQKSGALLGIFNPITKEIIRITSAASIETALSQIQNTKKVYAMDSILHDSFAALESIQNSYNTRFVWITDSDLMKSNTINREREYFDFLMKLQSQNNISFSYFGYGEVPAWAVMNQSLKNVGGNSYYVDGPPQLESKLWDDYKRFSYPTVKDIKINVSLMPWIHEARYDYRPAWYPVSGFRPVSSYYTHTTQHELKSMDQDEHKIFLHYLSIGPENTAASDLYFRTVVQGRTVPIGFCSVEYYSWRDKKTKYKTFPLSITYTDDYSEYEAAIDAKVSKYTVLQNTGFILKELSGLVNSRQYYTAILLVDSQIKMLKKYLAQTPGKEIEGDIETLEKNRTLLMEQARSLNYIR